MVAIVRRKRTLRYKFIVGFIIVTVPLIVFLFYNNDYAMNVVREQVSQSNGSWIATQAAKKDIALEQTLSYLLKQATGNTSYWNLLALSTYPESSGDYFFAKQSLLQSFEQDQDAYKEVDTFFIYLDKPERLITRQRTYDEIERYHRVLDGYLADRKTRQVHRWDMIREGNTYYLVRLEQVSDSDVYIGALIQTSKLVDELPTGAENPEMEELLVSGDGVPLTKSSVTAQDVEKIERSLREPGDEAYRKFKRSSDGRGYLAVSADFAQAPIHMVAIVPEETLLKQLFYFQWAIYLIPVLGVIVILFYSFFLKRTLLRPMQALISGMRRIKYGDLGVRLAEESTFEFAFLADTFNGMAGQINRLKIDVYEEMLKKQEAEFKHLQAQINPHFYLNSLNIIYSLSALRKNDLVEKMTEHLADYFRFITRAHREFITLAEEIGHVANYLEIQKLRFPDKLAYRIDLPERYAGCAIPPLVVQSFVENAVIHGMPEGESLFVISIAVSASTDGGEGCEIAIADNGCGLAPEKLKALQDDGDGLAAGQGDGRGEQGAGGLGIWNVRRRLGLVYGNRAGVRFFAGEPCGTVVRVRIPVEHEYEGGGGDV